MGGGGLYSEFTVFIHFMSTMPCFCGPLRCRNKVKNYTFLDDSECFFRSDVLGQILPVVGQAWAQSGVVCVDTVIFFHQRRVRQ